MSPPPPRLRRWSPLLPCLLAPASAMLLAPHGCEGGLTAYLLVGAVAVTSLLALPFLLEPDTPAPRRLGRALAQGIAGSVLWLVAFELSDMPLLCRLW